MFSIKDYFTFDKKIVIFFPDNCSLSSMPFQASEYKEMLYCVPCIFFLWHPMFNNKMWNIYNIIRFFYMTYKSLHRAYLFPSSYCPFYTKIM